MNQVMFRMLYSLWVQARHTLGTEHLHLASPSLAVSLSLTVHCPFQQPVHFFCGWHMLAIATATAAVATTGPTPRWMLAPIG